MTVYVTQERNDHDFSAAEAWGELEFLTAGDFANARNSINNKELVNRLRFLLRRFTSEDWIVIAGSPYVSAAVFLMLGQAGFQTVQLLRWDNKYREYKPLYIEVPRTCASNRR